MVAGTDGVLENDDVELDLAAAIATTVAIGACPPTALAPNFRDLETGRGSTKNGTVVSEKPKISDVSA